jgi:nitroreductase
MIKDLILKNRSYRRFHEDVQISLHDLEDMVDSARLSASGRNAQPLKYMISNEPELNKKIFSTLAWAGYLTDWPGPEPGERPSAYMIILHDRQVAEKYFCDDGIAIQSILLSATEKGYGGCIIGTIKKTELQEYLHLNERFTILEVIALGKPKEKVVIEEMKDGDVKYWRDKDKVHHVPKRKLEEIILKM